MKFDELLKKYKFGSVRTTALNKYFKEQLEIIPFVKAQSTQLHFLELENFLQRHIEQTNEVKK